MAEDDPQPSSDIDIDPAHPDEPSAITAEGKQVAPAERVSPDATSDPLVKIVSDYIKGNQAREAQREQEAAPIRAALMKEMAQPLPQMPSMTEASPYGLPPDPNAQQANRGGILSGIMYGIIGLGLAKIFAGRNKSAYYGAMEGIGEALRQRNSGNQTQANQNFERWVKLNEIWHQQLRDRSEDYKQALENRKLSENEKLSLLSVIANSHGNVQGEAAANKGDIELLMRMDEHQDKMRLAQQKQAWKMKEDWYRRQGNDATTQKYRRIMHQEYGIDVDQDPDRAEQAYPFSEFLRDEKQMEKTKPGEKVPPLGSRGSSESNPLGLVLPQKPAAPPQGTTGEY